MAGFFDRLKQGAAEAGKKAQETVELNRLRIQLSSKEKEVAELYEHLGEAVYQAYQANQLGTVTEEEMERLCRQVTDKKAEMAQIEEKIRLLRNEKLCPSCGSSVMAEARFCPNCGYHLAAESESVPEKTDEDKPVEVMDICPNCNTAVAANDLFCGECGHKLKE